MKKFLNTLKKPFYWIATKYAALPFYLQWAAFGVIASPAIASFLIIWFSLNSMGEHSFGRWLLAVIPAFSTLLGIVMGLTYASNNPPNVEVEEEEEKTEE